MRRPGKNVYEKQDDQENDKSKERQSQAAADIQ